jgi:hypothetical protein
MIGTNMGRSQQSQMAQHALESEEKHRPRELGVVERGVAEA